MEKQAPSRAVKDRYGEKNVSRMNALVGDGVPVVPWDDPAALAVWYQTHYAKKRTTLPNWILKELARTVPVVKTSDSPAPEPEIDESPVEFFGRNLRALQSKINGLAASGGAEPSALGTMLRTYESMLKTWQDAKERELREDASKFVSREAVCNAIDAIHARLPRRLAGELKSARASAARACVDQAQWVAFCEDFFTAAMRTLVETRFSDAVATTTAEAA